MNSTRGASSKPLRSSARRISQGELAHATRPPSSQRNPSRAVPFLALALFVAGCEASEPKRVAPERIFLFVVDTLRKDHVSAYGTRSFTPNIDALAARGVRIDTAVSAFHQTTMSMGALFTGRTPALETGNVRKSAKWTGRTWCGLSRFSSRTDKACVPNRLTTLAERLSEAGYWTAGVTANRLLFKPYGFSQGFDRWEQVGVRNQFSKSFPASDTEARFVHQRTLEALSKRPSDRFFLYVHWLDVHEYRSPKVRRLRPGEQNSARYARSVREFDAEFGDFLHSLETQGLLEDAWIIFTSDHGESLGEPTPLGRRSRHRGNPSFEPELQVPLITVPRIFPTDLALVRGQDVAGLLLDALELEPIAQPSKLASGEHFVSEIGYQVYRNGNLKSMHARRKGTTHLFDLGSKEGEEVDIAANHPELVTQHKKRLAALTQHFGTDVLVRLHLTDEDVDRMRALGYLE